MGFNIKEIVEAWSISFRPTPKQKEMAEERLYICENECTFNKTITNIKICTKCGCPIKKKVFTNKPNPCPLKKWEEVDQKYFKVKTTKTLL